MQLVMNPVVISRSGRLARDGQKAYVLCDIRDQVTLSDPYVCSNANNLSHFRGFGGGKNNRVVGVSCCKADPKCRMIRSGLGVSTAAG